FLSTVFLALALLSFGQSARHKTEWIQHPESDAKDYGVYFLKAQFSLKKVPENFIVNVSADNRYKLYVNGKWAGLGPARGDLKNWFYESYDLKPYLKRGRNIITAEVWNFGEHKPLAQISSETGFYFHVENKNYRKLNSGAGKWQIRKIEAYDPIAFGSFIDKWYYVCGPGDSLNYSDYPVNWMKDKRNSAQWHEAKVVNNSHLKWNLIPREIPHLTRNMEKITALDRIEGDVLNLTPSREPFKNSIIIPSNKRITLLFDQEYLTVGYPVLKFSKGNGSQVKITYAESLYHPNRDKGNRDVIENKEIIGYHDHFIADGRKEAEFIPLWWRTFRYIQLDIVTRDEELVLEDFYNYYVAYPYEQNAIFKTDKPVIDDIMEAGIRTLKLCSGETFYDCPYYEQLQYIGDTRVQALIKMYMTGDDRLVRNAITQFSNTFIDEGLTLSRHPANYPQIIP
ncbi:MAG: family 78 glycoside hydrolase catalytic domain, partial [Bacteroidales bacterium]